MIITNMHASSSSREINKGEILETKVLLPPNTKMIMNISLRSYEPT